MILRRRPLILLSSAISGLRDLREQVAKRLGAMDLAEQWLFETHATAAGEPAEAHYLDIARSCDLMVVIVGDRRTEGTEDEYHEAFRDNPDKILPFFVGEGSDEVREFRDLLQRPDRHLRKKVATEAELVDVICEAVEQAVRSGHLITPPIRRALAERLDALDRLIALDPPRSYIPALQAGNTALSWAQAWPRFNPMALLGPGGAGKTYGALAALQQLTLADRVPLRQRAGQDRAPLDVVIPLYLRATAEAHTMPELIARAFASARFFPGQDLTVQYATDGRLAVVVDGHDDLVAAEREELLRSVAEWQASYPRGRIAVLARGVDEDQLPTWNRIIPAKLSEDQIREMFELEGQPIRGMQDIPAELTDLVIWPFWCSALARYGLASSSGLALLQSVTNERLAGRSDAIRATKIRAALGVTALDIHPAAGVSAERALEILSRWQRSPAAQQRFEAESAESLLEAMRQSGLLQAEDEQLVFLHPLLAAVLAAEAAQDDPGQDKVRSSPELSVFTAALLGEDQHEQLLELLVKGDIFFAARVLRLSVPRERSSDLETDRARYQQALRTLAFAAGPEAARELQSSSAVAAQGEGWTALTHVPQAEGAVLPGYPELTVAAKQSEVVVWQDSPFARRLPEHLAAAEVLLRFKRSVDQLTRADLEMQQPCPPAPKDADELSKRLLEHTRAVGQAERDLREKAGLRDTPTLPTLDGEPRLKIVSGHGGRWIEETWGPDQAAVAIEAEWDQEKDHWDGVARFLDTEPTEAARKRLRDKVEKEIGSNLGSAAWNRPTALAGWVW